MKTLFESWRRHLVEVGDEQKKRLQGRMEEFLIENPKHEELFALLLSHGGEMVVPNYENPRELQLLMTRGTLFDPKDYNVRDGPGGPSNCHGNAAEYCDRFSKNGFKIATGWALSDDGLWRQHSWVMNPERKELVETTVERELYFGSILEGEDEEDFFAWNLDEAWGAGEI